MEEEVPALQAGQVSGPAAGQVLEVTQAAVE